MTMAPVFTPWKLKVREPLKDEQMNWQADGT